MSLIPLLILNPYTWLIAAAVIPAIWLLILVYRKDHLEKEPGNLLVALVLFGIVSTFLASVTENLGIALLPFVTAPGSLAYNLLLYFVVVGLSEEGFKYLVLRFKTWRNPNFNCQFDGVVYAVFVSLGFALWENIGYTISYGISTALVRAVTAVPGHTCFGVFSGLFYGAAKRYDLSGDASRSRRCRIASVVIPMLLHGTYDFIASGEEAVYSIIFIGFVAVLFFASYRLVKVLSQNDRYLTQSGDII